MTHTNPHNNEHEWFGFEKIQPETKKARVADVFHGVANKYDIMNDAMSGGMHRLWKNRLLRQMRPQPHECFLDMAGGTGDIAFRIHAQTNGQAPITVCDINPSMLSVGQDRAVNQGRIENLTWVVGDAEKLPFADSSFDVYSIAFGLRNVTYIDAALKEAWRVLKPGGRFYCLEFSHVPFAPLRKAYDLYSHHVIPKLGQAIAGDAESYQYLVESIRQFPTQAQLVQRLKQAGFAQASYQNLTAGVVAIHTAYKF